MRVIVKVKPDDLRPNPWDGDSFLICKLVLGNKARFFETPRYVGDERSITLAVKYRKRRRFISGVVRVSVTSDVSFRPNDREKLDTLRRDWETWTNRKSRNGVRMTPQAAGAVLNACVDNRFVAVDTCNAEGVVIRQHVLRGSTLMDQKIETLVKEKSVKFNYVLVGELARLASLTTNPDAEAFLARSIKELVTGDNLGVTPAELEVASKNKISAIKLYRERTRQGLKESKDAIEAAMQKAFGRVMDNRTY